MKLKKMAGFLLILALLVPMAVLAENTSDTDSILEVSYEGFSQVEPYVEYVKTPFAGGFVNLRWAPSLDSAVQHRMNDGGEVIVYAKDTVWAQVMDSESGYIGFVRNEFLTKEEPPLAMMDNADEHKPFVDFDIKMDSIPEGYSFETEENSGSLYATFKPEDPDAVLVYVSVTYAPVFSGYTLTSELSEEELEAAREVLIADYNEPTVEMEETEYGTALFIITESDAQSAYADMVSVWHGYVFRIDLQKTSELTDEDLELATKIASDMWVIEL